MRRLILLLSLSWSLAISAGAARADDATDCFSLGSKSYADPAFWQTALDACTRLIRTRTGKPLAATYSARGSWLHKQGKYDAALADYDRALSIDKTNVEYYDYRGDSLHGKGDLDGAIGNYNQAIRVDPTYAAAYYSRGRIYLEKDDVERARESFHAALAQPKMRKGRTEDRIQDWAQSNATKQLERLDAPPPVASPPSSQSSGK